MSGGPVERVYFALQARDGSTLADLAEVVGMSEDDLKRVVFKLWRAGLVAFMNKPCAGRVALLPLRPAGPLCIVCQRPARWADAAGQPCHVSCQGPGENGDHDAAVGIVRSALGGVVVYEGTEPPVRARDARMDGGPCAGCKSLTRRYGPNGGPLCRRCRSALPPQPRVLFVRKGWRRALRAKRTRQAQAEKVPRQGQPEKVPRQGQPEKVPRQGQANK